jgi:nucleotide-binding universal stress UspA family protein
MSSSGRIVVGVDGSDASLDAVRFALRQAELTGSRVEAVTSWQYPTQYGVEFYGEELDWDTIAATTLESALRDVRGAPPGSSVVVEQRVQRGHPAEVLVEASDGAELLVVGSRGHGGFVGMLVGSVSEHVIAHAYCPVVVVRHAKGH